MSAPTPDQPGWFTDPDADTAAGEEAPERWYDGERWTDHRRLAADAVDDAPPAAADLLTVGGGRGLRVGLVVVGALVLLAGAAAGVVLALGNDDGSDAPKVEPTPSSVTPTPAPSAPSSTSPLTDIPTIAPSDFPTQFRPSTPAVPQASPSAPAGFPTDLPQFPTDPAEAQSMFTEFLKDVQR